MPITEQTISLAVVGDTIVIPPGQQLNAVSVTGLTPGASCQLKLGNNPPITVDFEGVLRIGNEALLSDANQGLIVRNLVAQPGASIRLVPSYRRAVSGPRNDEITYGAN